MKWAAVDVAVNTGLGLPSPAVELALSGTGSLRLSPSAGEHLPGVVIRGIP